MADLRIDIDVPAEPARRSSAFPVRVGIDNVGPEAVVVNRRLAIGYRDSQARELFAEVYRPGGDEVVSRPTQLYQRDLAGPEDYVELAPGNAVEGTFDLFEWYELPAEPGPYELVVFYQADEPLAAAAPPAIVPGLHESARIAFELGG